MCIATLSKMPHSRILNADSLTGDPYGVTLSKESFLICTWRERLKTPTLNKELVTHHIIGKSQGAVQGFEKDDLEKNRW